MEEILYGGFAMFSVRVSSFLKHQKRRFLSSVIGIEERNMVKGSILLAQMLKARNKKKFRQEHQAELELYESAAKFFKKKNADGKIPSMRHNAAPDGIFPFK